MKNRYLIFYILILVSCGEKTSTETASSESKKLGSVNVPPFNNDSAYVFVKKQLAFGPRVPNTKAHVEAGDYLVRKLKSYGAEVVEQEFIQTSFDGVNLNLRNIIGSFYPEKTKRILLGAHWDSRPFADKDSVDTNKPIDGANDGASGVAVLLEIARSIKNKSPDNVGIDIIFFDGEDWGETSGYYSQPPEGLQSWYCLGSQYWAAHKHKKGYSAYYGIILDMVGARDSHFFIEGASYKLAPKIVDKVWQMASALGYSPYFVNERKGEITDDHIFLNTIGKIPTIDIVHFDPEHGYFGDYHHTHRDNIEIIDPNVLGVVGTTLLNVIYYE